MKVPIEDARDEVAKQVEEENTEVEVAEEPEVELEDEAAAESEVAEAAAEPAGERELTPEEEAELIEAAKRAGVAAAEADMKAEEERAADEAARAEEAYALGEDGLDALKGVAAEMLAAAKKEAAESKDRLIRLQADWDNFRRRTAAERLAEKDRAAEKVVTNLLPVLDDMERACEHAGASAGDDETFAQFVDGVRAIHDKMLGILAKEGVEVIDPAGEPFDPLEHQAVGRQEDKDAYEETVAQVYQKGYRMGDKVIRAAMVTVTFGGPRRPAEEPAEN